MALLVFGYDTQESPTVRLQRLAARFALRTAALLTIANAGPPLPPHAVRGRLYIGGVWIRQPQELACGHRRGGLFHPRSAVSTARPEVAVSPNREHRFAVGWGGIDLCDSANSRPYRGGDEVQRGHGNYDDHLVPLDRLGRHMDDRPSLGLIEWRRLLRTGGRFSSFLLTRSFLLRTGATAETAPDSLARHSVEIRDPQLPRYSVHSEIVTG